jgi:group I intron endonuclease
LFDFTLKDDPESTLLKCGIYKITCTTNGKFYIGSTSQSFRIRFTGHRKDLRSESHHSKYFQNCYNKYTEASFKLEVLEVMDKTVDDFKTILLDREQFHMDENLPELNMYPSARSPLGFKRDDDFCNKIRDAAISRFTSNTGESNIYWYNNRFIVDVRHKRVGSFTSLEEAVVARNHYINTKETFIKPTLSKEPYITSQDTGWKVLVKGVYVGYYKDLTTAIQKRDLYLETGAKDVPDKNTEWKVKPLLRPTQYIRKANNIQYSVMVRGVTLGHCFPSYEAAVEARDIYIEAQNKLVS